MDLLGPAEQKSQVRKCVGNIFPVNYNTEKNITENNEEKTYWGTGGTRQAVITTCTLNKSAELNMYRCIIHEIPSQFQPLDLSVASVCVVKGCKGVKLERKKKEALTATPLGPGRPLSPGKPRGPWMREVAENIFE